MIGLALFGIALAVPCTATAEPIKGSLDAGVKDGYARLVFTMGEDADATVRIAANVLIVSFQQPIDVAVDRLAAQVPEYIGAARRDPDGRAIRIALLRKVTVNSVAAAETLYVDLLPDGWSGAPPGLPQEVIGDLVRRLRVAERLVRLEHLAAQPTSATTPVRVRIANLPTFTRYVFDIPEQTAVTAERRVGRLTLSFDAPLTFDLGDVVATLPRAVEAISAQKEAASASVAFTFLARVQVRTFREDGGYVVDLIGADAKSESMTETPPAAPLVAAAPAKAPNGAAPGGIEAAAAAIETAARPK